MAQNNRDLARISSAFLAILSLLALYLFFLNYFFGSLINVMSEVESIIFYAMILRVLGITLVPYLRRMHPQIKILVFSFETFILVGLIVAFAFTGDIAYNALMGLILTTWLGVSLVVLTPYAIYQLGLMMYRGNSITSVVLSGAPEIAVGLFLGSLVFRVKTAPTGLSDFGTMIINSLRAEPGVGETGNIASSSILAGASTIFFIAIMVYAIFGQKLPTSTTFSGLPRYQYALVLVLLGIISLYIWTFSSPVLGGNVFVMFSIPAIAIAITLWGLSRG